MRRALPSCGRMELDQVQATYDRALRRVMSDLTGTTDLRLSVVVDFTDPDGLEYLYQAGDGSSHGRALNWIDDEESATVTLADLIQDDALEKLWGPAWRHARAIATLRSQPFRTAGQLGSALAPAVPWQL